MKRRALIKSMLALLLGGCILKPQSADAESQYDKTPSDSEGPYYPASRQKDEDNNLLQVAGQSKQAEGDVLNLRGVLLDTQGKPQKRAIIEIWQTDSKGRYKHPDDSSPGQRDPNFQYWGKAVTDADGAYSFKTLLPQHYSFRPPHIHFKVWINSNVRLTSQLYFKNHPTSDRSAPWGAALQTTELKTDSNGDFKSFFRIVI